MAGSRGDGRPDCVNVCNDRRRRGDWPGREGVVAIRCMSCPGNPALPVPMASVVSWVMWGDVDDFDDGRSYDDARAAVTSVLFVDERAAAEQAGGGDQDGGQ